MQSKACVHSDLVDPTMWQYLNISDFDGLSRSIVVLLNTGFSFSMTYSTHTKIREVFYNRQVMLTTRGHLITALFWSPCLCIKYFGNDCKFILMN